MTQGHLKMGTIEYKGIEIEWTDVEEMKDGITS